MNRNLEILFDTRTDLQGVLIQKDIDNQLLEIHIDTIAVSSLEMSEINNFIHQEKEIRKVYFKMPSIDIEQFKEISTDIKGQRVFVVPGKILEECDVNEPFTYFIDSADVFAAEIEAYNILAPGQRFSNIHEFEIPGTEFDFDLEDNLFENHPVHKNPFHKVK